ncbi:MAG: flagellar type III secretion system pore protein FliP, partial [Vulcanimicrobiaceae bacterium]
MDDLFALAAHTRASLPLDVLAGLTLLSLVPFIAVMTTSFVRIVVVLSLVRSAIGSPTVPPSMVLTGLAIVLTVLVMTPTLQTIRKDALEPYIHGRLSQSAFIARAVNPLQAFMRRQTRAKDLAVFARVARRAPTE